ncbi:MAG: sugar ABC transporter permease [Rhodobacteraceae bacterium]|uniref:carbohydrate ABC transporter permease n=1 Tax=Amaricoccus sp. B4 TaxID=3368557 RepID=UPI000DAE9407|nr:sugar ABC transporter permease [Paracoccaceae bacterium]
MATQASRSAARLMISPTVILLFLWMAIPLGTTIYYSLQRYQLLYPDRSGFVGLRNYTRFVLSPGFGGAVANTLILVLGVLIVTVVLGILIALLIDRPIWGQGPVRILVISPFFIMPPVSALIWKNMFFNPSNGLFAEAAKYVGMAPYDFLGQAPLASIIFIVSWEWLPFATLILLTALQSLDGEQLEAAEMDGAPPLSRFWYIMLPHMSRAITVVVLIQTIFLLGVFGEILVTTNGGPGTASTTLPFLIYKEALLDFDAGTAAAGGVVAVILANIVAIFLMKAIGKNLD